MYRVGLFFDARHLRSWQDFRTGHLPLSGTDGMALTLADGLHERGLPVVCYTTRLAGDRGPAQQQVAGLAEAVRAAKMGGMDLLGRRDRRNFRRRADTGRLFLRGVVQRSRRQQATPSGRNPEASTHISGR